MATEILNENNGCGIKAVRKKCEINYISHTAKFYEKWLRRKQWLRWRAMRTSVRWTTASQTKTGTTRTTCSSPSTTPVTTLTHGTPTIAWCTCIETARIFVPQLVMIHAHLMAQVLSAFTLHPWSSTWRTLLGSTSPFSKHNKYTNGDAAPIIYCIRKPGKTRQESQNSSECNTQNNAGWDCFKTPILWEILRTPNLRQVEHCAFLEVIRLL